MADFLGFAGVEAVIFDCDGVVVDSEPASQGAWALVLSRHGVELEAAGFAEWIGRTDLAIAEHFGPRLGLTAGALEAEAAQALVEILTERGLAVFEDARSAVASARAAGLAVALATNSTRRRFEALVSAAGFTGWFEVSVTADDVGSPKPAPDIYQEVARRLAVDPGKCLVVEDTPTGVMAANAAGMRVLAVDRGVFGRGELEAAGSVVTGLIEAL